ncbi:MULTISPECIES: YaiI/YqxD family protein [unclassified Oceanispirochaeta]|uniref:YaiI/YqxD family protein n=1 Tax=unclassified Oceanispirochaeta TaxID=2635722 RepID=UPI000E095D7E|nr:MULTISPECIES: YaiI/YqxD family protein [unclassified Oceanispirochaeta]MBF9018688.1 YaiI/YqxD family protein [Oceanispirochaeta sp. M2]NPD75137.1 YaiI/YqxD family protein [Oceanispirochaeta sp. M1]RDG29022.1 YaiI/YqxD family protein [Oceanispirochaeta sp. M1]
MKIWVDADACPVAIKEILFRCADRRNISITLVANQTLRIPKSPNISFIKVPAGFDVADNEIVKQMKSGDLVITADIPLASEVIDEGGIALNPRGDLYTQENVKSRLAMRNLMDTLRSGGMDTGGPAALNKKDIQAFANQLDRWLTKHIK